MANPVSAAVSGIVVTDASIPALSVVVTGGAAAITSTVSIPVCRMDAEKSTLAFGAMAPGPLYVLIKPGNVHCSLDASARKNSTRHQYRSTLQVSGSGYATERSFACPAFV